MWIARAPGCPAAVDKPGDHDRVRARAAVASANERSSPWNYCCAESTCSRARRSHASSRTRRSGSRTTSWPRSATGTRCVARIPRRASLATAASSCYPGSSMRTATAARSRRSRRGCSTTISRTTFSTGRSCRPSTPSSRRPSGWCVTCGAAARPSITWASTRRGRGPSITASARSAPISRAASAWHSPRASATSTNWCSTPRPSSPPCPPICAPSLHRSSTWTARAWSATTSISSTTSIESSTRATRGSS